MKKILTFVFVFLCVFSFVQAEYKSNLAAGNSAYKKGNLEEALMYYNTALEEQPSDQLMSFTDKIRKKIDDKKQREKSVSGGSDKTALIALDAALAGFAIFSFLDYSSSAASYEELYAAINNSTPESYRVLLYEKKQVEQKGTFMAFAAGAAGAAVVYTLIDVFVLSGGGSSGLRADIQPQSEYAGLTAFWRF
jgi:hypothetical protein